MMRGVERLERKSGRSEREREHIGFKQICFHLLLIYMQSLTNEAKTEKRENFELRGYTSGVVCSLPLSVRTSSTCSHHPTHLHRS